MTRRSVGTLVAVGATAAIALATLTPERGPSASRMTMCILCGGHGLQDFVLNVLLFLPLGAGLALVMRSASRTMLVIVGATIAIELAQLGVISGRDSTLGDIVANSIGGACGVLLAAHWTVLLRPPPRVAARLAGATAVVSGTILLATGWAFGSDATSSTYFAQLAPDFTRFDQFDGDVSAATLDGRPFPATMAASADFVRDRLRRDSIDLDVVTTAGSSSERAAPIATVFDAEQQKILWLARDGNDAVFETRLRANAARLRAPSMRLKDAFLRADGRPLAPIDTIRLTGRRAGDEYELRARTRALERSTRWVVRRTSGWSLFVPFEHAFSDFEPWATICWLFVPLALIAYWLRRAL